MSDIDDPATFTVGDRLPALTGRVTDDGDPVDCTGATIVVHIARPSGSVITRTAEFTDEATGAWSMAWTVDDLTESGTHSCEGQVTRPDGLPQTFGPSFFYVRPQIA